jgi:hypothetical protein
MGIGEVIEDAVSLVIKRYGEIGSGVRLGMREDDVYGCLGFVRSINPKIKSIRQ